MTTKKTAPSITRKPRAKPPQKAASKAVGKLTRPEMTNLILQAQEAFNYQIAIKAIPPETDFNEWRRAEVMSAVGLAGLSKISRSHWRTVKAHFLCHSGHDAEAFELLTKTGEKTYRPIGGGDTWETSEAFAALIVQELAVHAANVVKHEKGHIREGWILETARQRTGKPTLTLATLAERLDPGTLHGLLAHLRNHIARREGRDDADKRKPRRYPKPADPG